MPKKKKDGKGKKKKDIDWASDENFDKNRSMIYIEHTHECAIFQVKADEFLGFLQEQFPERLFVMVRNQYGKLHPRPGAFEISFSQNARTSHHDLWSGIDKGPPRREKFPRSYNQLLPQVQFVLKKFYAEKTNLEDELDDMPYEANDDDIEE